MDGEGGEKGGSEKKKKSIKIKNGWRKKDNV